MKSRLGSWLVMGVVLAGCTAALSQTVYRVVGPDGRVTFSDQPPLAAPASGVTAAVPGSGSGSVGTALPYELRQVVNRYPVTLYTSPDCVPCSSGRTLLNGRGVPFVEKTVTTNDDIAALKRLSGETALPFLTIGGQQLRGYSDAEWGQFLDAAGYPKTSKLPNAYRNVPASPLVTVQAPTPAGPGAANADAPTINRGITTPSPAPAVPSRDNPAGIRF